MITFPLAPPVAARLLVLARLRLAWDPQQPRDEQRQWSSEGGVGPIPADAEHIGVIGEKADLAKNGPTVVGPLKVQVYRVGPTSESEVYFGGTYVDTEPYSSLHEGHEVKAYKVETKNTIAARDHFQLYAFLHPGKTLQDAIYNADKASFKKTGGRGDSMAAWRKVQRTLMQDVAKKGFDSVLFTQPPAPAKAELVVINKKSSNFRNARAKESALHAAADRHVPALSVALRYAFAKGRGALRSTRDADKAASAVKVALTGTLEPTILKTLIAGGEVGAGVVLRVAAFNPDQPRDQEGKWTADGVGFHGTTKTALPFILEEGIKPYKQGGVQDALGAAVFISTHRTDAEEYAKNTRNGVVLEVHVPKNEQTNFKSQYGTVFTTDKTIPPAWIKGVYERRGERDKNGLEVFSKVRSLAVADGVVFFVVVNLSPVDRLPAKLDDLGPPPATANLKTAKAPATPKLAFRFDAASEAATDWAKRHAAELIDDVTETSRKRIRAAIAGLTEGEDWGDATDEILAAVGDEDRAQLIARHETMTAASEGQRQAWDQAVEKGLLTGDERRMWITVGDEKVCPICEPLDGTTADLDGTYDGDIVGPPAHVACRCTEGLA